MGNGVHPLRGPQPTGTVEGLKLEEVRTRLTSTSPEKVAAAGHAYGAAAGKLSTAHQELAEAIAYLGEHWRGPAAEEAMAALRKLKATATALATTSNQTGRSLQQYGEKILPWYKSHLPGDGFIRTGSDDEYAQKLMTRLNSRITQTYTAVPMELPVILPGIEGGASASTDLSGRGSAGDGGFRGVSTDSRTDIPVTAGSVSHADEPTGSNGESLKGDTPGTDLASVHPALDGSPGLGSAPGTPAGGAATGGAVGGGPVSLSPGMGIRTPATGGPGQGISRGGPGNMGRGTRTAPMGHAGLGANVIGGLGGAGRSEGEERERSTWLVEDADVWGTDVDESAPSVIGELSPTEPAEGHPGQIDHDDQWPEADSESPSTTNESDEKDELDLVLDQLEAELDLELASLGKEDRGAP